MQLHTLQPRIRSTDEKRVGRGGKRGTTSGRGTKGQKARAGAKIRPAIRDIIKKIPKLRGYRFRSFRPKPVVVGLGRIVDRFPSGAVVDAEALIAARLLYKEKGKIPAVKVVGGRDFDKRLFLKGLLVTRPAARRIKAAGGTIVLPTVR